MPSSTKPAETELRTRRTVEFAIWISVAVGMWAYSYSFDRELSTYAFGPVAWPRAVILLIAVVAVLSFLSDLRRARGMSATADGDQQTQAGQLMDGAARLRLACAILLPQVYVWLLPRAG